MARDWEVIFKKRSRESRLLQVTDGGQSFPCPDDLQIFWWDLSISLFVFQNFPCLRRPKFKTSPLSISRSVFKLESIKPTLHHNSSFSATKIVNWSFIFWFSHNLLASTTRGSSTSTLDIINPWWFMIWEDLVWGRCDAAAPFPGERPVVSWGWNREYGNYSQIILRLFIIWMGAEIQIDVGKNPAKTV